MSSLKTIARHSAVFSAGMMFEQVSSSLLGFFVARLLGPRIQGIWQTARLLRIYSELSSLGQPLGMRREVGVALGAGKQEEVELQRDTSFVWNTFSLLAAALAVAVYALAFPHTPLLRNALVAMALTIAVTGASTFFNLWYKTTGGFGILALASIGTGVGSLVSIALLLAWGFNGLIAGYVLANAAALAVMAAMYREPFRLRFSFEAWWRSLRVGFPLFLIGAFALIFSSLDRIVVVSRMGFSNMGFYSVAYMLFLPLEMAVASISVVLLPRVCQRFGADSSALGLNRFYLAPLSVLMLAIPSVAGFMALFLPALIRLLLPQYEPAIRPAQIALAGLSFSAASGFCHNVLLAAGRTWHIVAASVVGSVVKLAVIWLLIADHGLSGIAAASAVGFMAQFAVLFMLSAATTRISWILGARALLESAVVGLACAGLWLRLGDAANLLRPSAVGRGWNWLLLAALLTPLGFAAHRLARLLKQPPPAIFTGRRHS
jgi:O-antigen/teichoic acid export membrane protein